MRIELVESHVPYPTFTTIYLTTLDLNGTIINAYVDY
jgi:hypothetical protein